MASALVVTSIIALLGWALFDRLRGKGGTLGE